MKIKVSEESVVCQGKPFEEMTWGNYQFPTIHFKQDGTVCCNTFTGEDTWFDIGKISGVWHESKDGCKTWRLIENKSEQPDVGTKLKNGDIVRFPSMPSIIVEQAELKPARLFRDRLPYDVIKAEADDSWPIPVFSYRDMLNTNYVYCRDTLPKKYREKKWLYYRIKQGKNELIEEYSTVNRPYDSLMMSLQDGKGVICGDWPICGIKEDAEGNVWAITYAWGHLNPINGGQNPYQAVELYKSTDNLKTFNLQAYIPFVPDGANEKTAWISPCFNESDIEFMDDGSIIILMRTVNAYNGCPEWAPMYFARSTDGGKTFSKPKIFDNIGVLPRLVKLKCGVTLAAYGRPGIFVRASEDMSGLIWDNPIEIMTPQDRSKEMNNPPKRPDFHQWAGSCCNVDLKAIGDNQALLVYSDFFYPDISGKTNKKVKTILSRIITVG